MTDLITITGNLAYEPEQKTIAPGVTVTNFRVGSTHRRFDKSTERWVDDYTSWYAVTARRTLGEHAFASLHKGDRVIVTGRLRVREWDNGTKRGLAVDIEADAVGHDLLWGTTSFRKAGQPAAPEEQSSPEPVERDERPATAAATDADGWVIPALPAVPADEAARLVDVPF
ncbi:MULTISPECIES: single-stranded DNA-binding protein [unclassified Microbacterium]|uniref:single-stranded DNA-binding protein n=1 Tax=unclassified Microbacterium TaxID=2609290 RepID=UPI0037453DD8